MPAHPKRGFSEVRLGGVVSTALIVHSTVRGGRFPFGGFGLLHLLDGQGLGCDVVYLYLEGPFPFEIPAR
jgi:hypothetical protein